MPCSGRKSTSGKMSVDSIQNQPPQLTLKFSLVRLYHISSLGITLLYFTFNHLTTSQAESPNFTLRHFTRTLKRTFILSREQILDSPSVKDCLKILHVDFVLIAAEKAHDNDKVAGKKYYIDTLVKELELDHSTLMKRMHILTINRVAESILSPLRQWE